MYSEFESASFEPAATGDNQIVETKDLQTDQEGVYAATVAPGDYTIELILSDIPDEIVLEFSGVQEADSAVDILNAYDEVVYAKLNYLRSDH